MTFSCSSPLGTTEARTSDTSAKVLHWPGLTMHPWAKASLLASWALRPVYGQWLVLKTGQFLFTSAIEVCFRKKNDEIFFYCGSVMYFEVLPTKPNFWQIKSVIFLEYSCFSYLCHDENYSSPSWASAVTATESRNNTGGLYICFIFVFPIQWTILIGCWDQPIYRGHVRISRTM